MTFLSPIWLWLAVPWAGIAVWMLRRRGRELGVPFVELWLEAKVDAPLRRGMRLPPLGVMLLLGAMLLAIAAAGRPVMPGIGDPPPFTLIWDRGAGAPAAFPDGLRRALAEQADWSGRVRVMVLPGGDPIETDIEVLAASLDALTATALDTRIVIADAVAEALRETDQPVVVLTPHMIPIDDPRLIVIHPPSDGKPAAIADLAFRAEPQPAWMMRIVNRSPMTAAHVRLGMDGEIREQAIDLPVKDESQAYFFDASALGEVISAELVVDGDVVDRAWLVRTGASPRIQSIDPQPPAIERMIDVYSSQRPTGAGAPMVLIAQRGLPETSPGVVIAPAVRTIERAELSTTDHPVLTNTSSWQMDRFRVTDAPLPEGFEAILSAGDQSLLAVRDQPARQVWIGMDTTAFADQPRFVMLWANVLRWVGGEQRRYLSQPPQTLGDGWRRIEPGPLPADVRPGWVPGVYRDDDGRTLAINSVPVDVADGSPADWRAAISRIAPLKPTRGARELSSGFLITALALAVGAAATWPARRSRLTHSRRAPR